MAYIPGSVQLAGFIAPTDSTDTFPVFKPIYGFGGMRTVSATTEMNAITTQRREVGMIVYVSGTSEYYKLESGLTNSDWVILNIGGTSGTTTASNGLTKTGNNITLGGALTAATTVVLGGNALQLSGEGASSSTVAWSGNPYYTRLLVNSSGSQLKTTYGTFGNNFLLASDTITINYTDGGAGTNMRMAFDGVNMHVTDAVNSRGLEYIQDYSPNFLANSLVTKLYVDNVVASGSTGNFLPISGGTVTGNTIFTSGLSSTTTSQASLNVNLFNSGSPTNNNGDVWFTTSGTSVYLNVNWAGNIKTVELT